MEMTITVRPASDPSQVVVNGELGGTKIFSLMIPRSQWDDWATAMSSGTVTVDESAILG